MSDRSQIQWTEATWNPTTGCTKVSPGCAHCYIERTPAFRIKGRRFVKGATDLRLHADRLDQPLHWRKPRRVFVNSLSDLFHDDISCTFLLSVFTTMQRAPQHTFQILTKRAESMREKVRWLGRKFADEGEAFPLPNVWLGVSVENQHFADARIPVLLETPAAVRFISAEPLLGPLNLTFMPAARRAGALPLPREVRERYGIVSTGYLDWVIVGGESGPGSRPFDLAWARSIVEQCRGAGVPCFVKQLGGYLRGDLNGCVLDWRQTPDGAWHRLPILVTPAAEDRVAFVRSHTIGGRLFEKKGGDPAEWPEDLRVRQWPCTAAVSAFQERG